MTAPFPALRLQLVPLDVLQALGVSSETDREDSSSVTEVAASDLPTAQIVVTSATPGPDGAVGDDVGQRLASVYRIDLARRLRRADATGKAGEIVAIELEDDTTELMLVLGLGDGGVKAAREAGAKLAGRIDSVDNVLCDVAATFKPAAFRAFCEGLLLASYRFSRKSTATERNQPVVQLPVAAPARLQPVLDEAIATAKAVCMARDLSNRPSNEKDPAWLAVQAREVGKQSGCRVRVLDEPALERGGFGGLLAVGAGSANGPRMVIMEYPGLVGEPHVVLVGKGITFDSGGLSIKPAEGMPLMKTDMSGASAVLGVMSALRDLGVTASVTGILACAENMPSGTAYRPGDVVKHYGGVTSEVFNTDAEGRMVLADALAYANLRLRPDVIVDIATLTGAATLGLSRHFGALYSDDSGLAKALTEAGAASNDKVWQMPLVEEYRFALDSEIADISHVSRASVGGGSITAALFLREFIGERRWAHLDIAGPGRAEAPRAELTRGATGFGVRLLLRWLSQSPNLY